MQAKLSEILTVFFIILVGMIPLFWWRPGYIIAKGDYFPLWLNQNEVSSDIFLYSLDYMGRANTFGSYLLYGILSLSLSFIGLSTGPIQILIQVFLLIVAGLSMCYLSITAYPKLELAPLISSVFYMFNLFVLQSRLNIGFVWTCAFLPLLTALLIKLVRAPDHQPGTAANKDIIGFSIALMITLSVASLNPANIILILLILTATGFYYLASQTNKLRSLLLSITKISILSIVLNLWWVIPFFNYYLWGALTMNPQISVDAWSWTHNRASFLNLLWLNGNWNWSPEYIPYFDAYANPIVIITTFVPFLLAAASLLFKKNESHFNTYLMLIVVSFLFLAKGLHEPLSQLNFALYAYLPGMNMFREPASKFTMAILPFVALLLGYTGHHIASIKIGKYKPAYLTKTVLATLFIIIFMTSAFPLLTNPVETKTSQLPFSSYVKIPDYYFEATEWLNDQTGDYKVLITPPNDFYQMPYTWGYYGTEFLSRILQKPVILNDYVYSYRTNPDTSASIEQVYNSIKYNRTAEFKALLDLLNIKYILQRNDILHNFTGRNIISPDKLRAFLVRQPHISLAHKFGQLDIYEYDEPKPYLYILSDATFKQIDVKVEKITVLERSWNFTSSTELQEWQNTTQPDRWQIIYTITQDNGTLRAELWNSTWGWKSIDSPLVPTEFGNTYQIQTSIKGQNAYQVHIKVAEYDADKNLVSISYGAFVSEGNFSWTHSAFNFEPINQTTQSLQIQIWHGHETIMPFPNIIWIDNIKIEGYTTRLDSTGLDLIFLNTTQPATILSYSKINPTKMMVTINATRSFTLAASESFDLSWPAFIGGKRVEPDSLYLGLKRYYINQTGLLEVTIEYQPQKWFYYGSVVSISAFLVCVAYLVYSDIRNRAMRREQFSNGNS